MPARSANRLNFTKTELAKISPPAARYAVYHDTGVEGLVLLAYWTGAFTFFVYKKIDGKPVRLKVGKYPDMSIEGARKKALELLGSIARGEHPQPKAQQKTGMSLGSVFDHYIDEYCKHHCTTWKATTDNFKRCFADWLERPVDTISHNDVQQMVNKLGTKRGHHTANRAYDDLRAVMTWGKKHGYVLIENPCNGVTKFKTRSRERFLTPDEFKKFFTKLKTETNIPFRDYVYLSLFTGARQANILSMRWEDINFDLGIWRIPITKNKESQTVPLTNLALQVLVDRRDNHKEDEEWVFPSHSASGHIVEPKKAWWKFLDKCEIEDLRLHDLRRTLGSYMAMNNQSLQMIGKVLGHRSPAATQIYSRLAFDPLRQAMENAQASMANTSEILPADMAKEEAKPKEEPKGKEPKPRPRLRRVK